MQPNQNAFMYTDRILMDPCGYYVIAREGVKEGEDMRLIGFRFVVNGVTICLQQT